MKFSEFDPATSAPALTDNLVGLTVPVTANSNRRWTFQQLVGAMPGAIFYVSPSGNDTNDGLSTSSPWKTITKVNASSFNPGDNIVFQGGQTFSGALVCPSAGTPAKPITFGSYGGGRATISSGTSGGFLSTNQSGIVVRDLIFTGSASINDGVSFINNSALQLQCVKVINCSVSGYGWHGIHASGRNVTQATGYNDVLFQGNTVTSCCSVAAASSGNGGTAGIRVWNPQGGYGLGTTSPSFNGVIIDNCYVSSCPGATDTNHTGSGIIASQVQGGVIRNCEATLCGTSANSSAGNGPSGIWCLDCHNFVIDSCRSIANTTANSADGNGFDIDAGCSNCQIINCYSEGNFSTGFLIYSFNISNVANDGSQLINCVSVEDGVGTTNLGGGIRVQNTYQITNVRIAGCSVYYSATNGAALMFKGAQVASITGEIVDSTLTVSAVQNIVLATPAGFHIRDDVIQSDINGIYYARPIISVDGLFGQGFHGGVSCNYERNGITLGDLGPVAWVSGADLEATPDTGISRIAPVSGVPTIAFGGGGQGDAAATFKVKTKAGAPTAADVPSGTWQVIRDTVNNTTKAYYNNAGTLMTAPFS